jgi:hypothetical protein
MKNQKSKIKDQKSKTRGFVALFTVLIAGIVLAMAIGIASVTYKELVLSSEARDANIAFFAADTGAECGLYWDIGQNVFNNNGQPSINCVGDSPSISDNYPIYEFEFSPTADLLTCTIVTINKQHDPNNDPTATFTRVTARGFNAPCTGSLMAPVGSRTIERSVSATYPNPVIVLPPGGGGQPPPGTTCQPPTVPDGNGGCI